MLTAVVEPFPELRKQLEHAHAGPFAPAIGAGPLRHRQMLADAQTGEYAAPLRDIRQPAPRTLERWACRHVVAIDQHASVRRRHEAHQRAYQGRLAHAITAEKPDAFARTHGERNPAQDMALPVVGVNGLGRHEKRPSLGADTHAAPPR